MRRNIELLFTINKRHVRRKNGNEKYEKTKVRHRAKMRMKSADELMEEY